MSTEENKPRVFYGWVVVAACFLATLTLGETFWSFGVFFKPLESDFGWSRAVTSSGYTAFLVGYAISLILGGRLADRHNNPRPILLASAMVSGLGIALCSQTHSINELRLFLFITGLGSGATWSVPNAIVMRWFSEHKRASVALAITTTGVGVGAVIFAPLINYFIRSFGWRDAFLYFGIMTFVIVLISALIIRPSPATQTVWTSPAGFEVPEPGPRNRKATRAMIAPFLGITFVVTVAMVSFQAISVHFAPHAIDEGISAASAAAALGLMGGFSIPGRLIAGPVSDIMGWRRTLALALFGIALSIIWLLFLDAAWMLYAFAFCYGICHGIRVPAQMGILQERFGLFSLGQLIGISTAIGQLCGAMAPYAAGFIYDQTGSYSVVFYILMAMLVATGLLAIMIKGQPRPAAKSTDH